MAEFVLRPKAVEDLESIWDYTVKTWGEEQAETYLRLINRGFVDLSRDPSLGRSCDEIREGYRKLRVGRHVIFYRPASEAVEIVRVLHQAMDFEQHLDTGE